ncbi:hypothetical protein AN958_00081 [Leucoagaricus sp. SymC.cos]|nr:hypothetical protein AN958_00081 [Leucoagaricus sp. SymC.cos]
MKCQETPETRCRLHMDVINVYLGLQWRTVFRGPVAIYGDSIQEDTRLTTLAITGRLIPVIRHNYLIRGPVLLPENAAIVIIIPVLLGLPGPIDRWIT